MPYLPPGASTSVPIARFIDRYLDNSNYLGWYHNSEIVDARISENTGLVRLYLADGSEFVVDQSVQVSVYHEDNPEGIGHRFVSHQ